MTKLQAEKNNIKEYYKGRKLDLPLRSSYRLTSPFGYRIHPERKLHAGLDMAAPSGTPIYAAESGVIIVSRGKVMEILLLSITVADYGRYIHMLNMVSSCQ